MLSTLEARPVDLTAPRAAQPTNEGRATVRQLAAYVRILANEHPEQAPLFDTIAKALIEADSDRREAMLALSLGNVDVARAIVSRPTTFALPARGC
jgi:hypothetical protein